MEKKHQIDACKRKRGGNSDTCGGRRNRIAHTCSMRFGEMRPAMYGPNANRKRPWITMPFFSYSAKNGANMQKEWIAAPYTTKHV